MTKDELQALQQEALEAHDAVTQAIEAHFRALYAADRAEEHLTVARLKFKQLRQRYIDALGQEKA